MFAFKRSGALFCSAAADGAGRRMRRAGDRTRRRRLNKLSCAGWVPHDRGFVLGLPHSRDERRSGDRLITAREGSPPRPCPPPCASVTLCSSSSSPGSGCDGGRHLINQSRLREAGNRPDEANHLAGDRGRNHNFRPAGRSQAPISRAQAELRFPGDSRTAAGSPSRRS